MIMSQHVVVHHVGFWTLLLLLPLLLFCGEPQCLIVLCICLSWACPLFYVQLFLTTRLSCLGRNDRAQATMVAAWLTELQLDQINELLLQVRWCSVDCMSRSRSAL
jgi:hypothetical protein